MEAFEIFKHDMILQPPLQHSVSDSPPDKTRLKGKERKKGSRPFTDLDKSLFKRRFSSLVQSRSFECAWSCMRGKLAGLASTAQRLVSPEVSWSKGCVCWFFYLVFFCPMSVPNNRTQERKEQSDGELESPGHLSTWLGSKIAVLCFLFAPAGSPAGSLIKNMLPSVSLCFSFICSLPSTTLRLSVCQQVFVPSPAPTDVFRIPTFTFLLHFRSWICYSVV